VGRLFLEIPDDVEKRFRIRVLELYGAKKGALSKALTEAIELWLKSKK